MCPYSARQHAQAILAVDIARLRRGGGGCTCICRPHISGTLTDVGRMSLIKTKYSHLQTAYLSGGCVCVGLQSQISDSVMIIKLLVYLLSLISIASSTVVSGDSSRGECPVWFRRNENRSCECGSELGGDIRCDPYKQVVSIMVGYCMSVDIPLRNS